MPGGVGEMVWSDNQAGRNPYHRRSAIMGLLGIALIDCKDLVPYLPKRAKRQESWQIILQNVN